ncbi:MAG: Ku protein [Methanomassiliicoccales archaeon]|nr:Ku protein [Methanomassiliicoccales archaeon]
MKAIWNGSLSFGLVNIPVKMYAAVERRPVNFKLLHEKDNSPIEYRRWCSQHDHEVPWNEVVKGVDLGEGTFYVLSKQELNSLKPKRSESIEIQEFVAEDRLERIWVDQQYYLGPDKGGQKAFFLLREVLTRGRKLAIANFVLREREYLAAIGPYGPGMLLTTLNYLDEIRSMESLEGTGEKPQYKRNELELAEQLIDKLTVRELDLSKFKDNYRARLKQAIEARDAKHLVQVEEEVKATPDANLLDALKASLES